MNNEIDKQDFREIIDGGGIFVDKSLLIRDVFRTGSRSFLVTRPHGFGKTIGLSMIDRFYNLKYAEEEAEHDSFAGLKLSRHSDYPRIVAKVRNRYPVIRINAGEIYDDDPEVFRRMFCGYLVRIAKEDFGYLESSEKLSERQRSRLSEILNSETERPARILDRICFFLEAHHGVRPIVLIDDYDAPLSRAYGKPCFEKLSMMYGNLIGCVSKWGEHISFAFMTGVQRAFTRYLSDEQNNIDHHSVQSTRFSSDFGFTVEDLAYVIGCRVDEMFPDLSDEEKMRMLEGKIAIAEGLYGGYLVERGNSLFNTKGVMEFVSGIGNDDPPVICLDGGSEQGFIAEALAGFGEPVLEYLELFRRSDETVVPDWFRVRFCWNYDSSYRSDIALILISYGYLTAEPVDGYSTRVFFPNENARRAFDELMEEVKKRIRETGTS